MEISEAIPSNKQLEVTGNIAVDSKPIDAYDEDGYTPLMRAVKMMDVNTVIEVIYQGANPRIEDGTFGTSTALDMAKLLLKRAKTPDEQQGFQKIVSVLKPIT